MGVVAVRLDDARLFVCLVGDGVVIPGLRPSRPACRDWLLVPLKRGLFARDCVLLLGHEGVHVLSDGREFMSEGVR